MMKDDDELPEKMLLHDAGGWRRFKTRIKPQSQTEKPISYPCIVIVHQDKYYAECTFVYPEDFGKYWPQPA